MLAELRHWFAQSPKTGFSAKGRTAFPPASPIKDCLPSLERKTRKVLSTTFHQGTKYRDFVSGIAPSVGSGSAAFRVTHGLLYQGAEEAKGSDGAVLIEVDEINPGPAVTIFGDTITAIESDKRLLPDGTVGAMTSSFQVLDEKGAYVDYSLPHHLYIVGAMNEADTSVEPLDVAFLRRFKPYRLYPDESALREYLALPVETQTLTATASSPMEVYEAAVQAWAKVNDRIEIARGMAFQIGHGIFMEGPEDSIPTDVGAALEFAASVWIQLQAHIMEVFFGDTRGTAAVLRADEAGSVFKLDESYFANSPVARLSGPKIVGREQVYEVIPSQFLCRRIGDSPSLASFSIARTISIT